MDHSIQKAKEIKELYEKIWLGLDNVTAVSIGKNPAGYPCIIISLEKDDEFTRDIFPAEIEGIPVEIRISGRISSL